VTRQPTLRDLLRERARSRPDGLAVVDGSVRLTWRELDVRVAHLTAGLAGHGVDLGSRVLWLGQNSYRILELLLAASELGAMVCPANWRYSADEMAFVLSDLRPALVVWQQDEIGDVVRAARSAYDGDAWWVEHRQAGAADDYDALLSTATEYVIEVGTASVSPDEMAELVQPRAETAVLLLYTAAFSGRPNAAMLSSTAIATQGLVMASLAGIDADYRYLNSGPMFHLGTLMYTFATFMTGGTNVFVPRTDAGELCRIIEAERCTGAFIVGPTFDQILELNRDGKYDLSSLRWPPGRNDWDAMVTPDTSPWAKRPGGYGQTEFTGMLTYAALGAGGVGSHGRTAPLMEMCILDPDGDEVPEGETGEIAGRGPTAMNGYWNRDEENARRRTSDGWLRTNDLGRREPDGTLTFIGPKTRMIKSAAENIYPAEVEAALAKHPAVAECAVIGIPDPKWVQSVRAVVVLRPGTTASEDDLIAHCKAQLASYKKPRSVVFAEALPRNGGLIDYDALDAAYGGGGYPGGTTRSA
jgi:long-chain acyl-CoA synthetase